MVQLLESTYLRLSVSYMIVPTSPSFACCVVQSVNMHDRDWRTSFASLINTVLLAMPNDKSPNWLDTLFMMLESEHHKFQANDTIHQPTGCGSTLQSMRHSENQLWRTWLPMAWRCQSTLCSWSCAGQRDRRYPQCKGKQHQSRNKFVISPMD